MADNTKNTVGNQTESIKLESPPRKLLKYMHSKYKEDGVLLDLAEDVAVENLALKIEVSRLKQDYEIWRDRATSAEKNEVFLRKFVKRVVCPNKLRYSIEYFPTRFLWSVDMATRRQNELHQKISSLSNISSFETSLCNIVRQIGKNVDKPNMNDQFKLAMERLRNLNYSLAVKSSGELQKAVFNLWQASDNTIAERLFSQQLDNIWRPRKNGLSDEDVKAIGELIVSSVEDVLDEQFANPNSILSKMVTDTQEVQYLYDAVKINQLFKPNISKHYKLCFWIFYNVKHPQIEKLNQKMAKEWPNLSKAQRVHLFSQEFAQLFNIISVMEKHGPGVLPPIDCVPDESDFNAYLDHLSISESQDLIFVAKTLCMP